MSADSSSSDLVAIPTPGTLFQFLAGNGGAAGTDSGDDGAGPAKRVKRCSSGRRDDADGKQAQLQFNKFPIVVSDDHKVADEDSLVPVDEADQSGGNMGDGAGDFGEEGGEKGDDEAQCGEFGEEGGEKGDAETQCGEFGEEGAGKVHDGEIEEEGGEKGDAEAQRGDEGDIFAGQGASKAKKSTKGKGKPKRRRKKVGPKSKADDVGPNDKKSLKGNGDGKGDAGDHSSIGKGDGDNQVAFDVFPEYQDVPTCTKCKRRVDPLRMRLVGKKQSVWQCGVCSSRYTQLHRHWGGWPPKEFDGLDEEAKEKFWKDLGDAKTGEEQKKVVMNCLSARVIESRIAGSKGQCLPLGVYATQGFDVAMIEQNCSDYRWNPTCGWCYRVDIDYQDKAQENQRVREEIYKSISERRQQGGNGGKSGKGKGWTGEKGKGKGNRLAEEPTVATKKMQGDAVRILAKVSPILFSMQVVLRHKKLKFLPQSHVDKQHSCISELGEMEKAAQKTVSRQDTLLLTMADVADKCSTASQHNNLMSKLLASL